MPVKRKPAKKAPRKPPASAATLDVVRRMTVWLGCVFPLTGPIKVVWTKALKDRHNLGECAHHYMDGRFVIHLRPGLSVDLAVLVLTHEWAHALTLPGLMVGEDVHSDRFYSVVGQIERAWNAGGSSAAARLSM